MDQQQFVQKVLGGTNSYPPAGWHDINGPTGKSAFLWSLSAWRTQQNRRGTLILPLMDYYDYQQTADWCGIDRKLIVTVNTNKSLLRICRSWIGSGLMGQIIFENLGFLLGGGQYGDDLKYLLGEVQELYDLTEAAEQNDVALYATSYNVAVRPGQMNEFSLGGRLLRDLCCNRRIKLEHQGYRLAAARRQGEYMRASNCLDLAGRRGYFEIQYRKGPVRIQNKL